MRSSAERRPTLSSHSRRVASSTRVASRKAWEIAGCFCRRSCTVSTGICATTQGESVPEALENLREATELYLEEFPLGRSGAPLVTTFEVPTHA